MGWYRNLDCGNVDFVQNGLNIIRKSGSKESRFHSWIIQILYSSVIQKSKGQFKYF